MNHDIPRPGIVVDSAIDREKAFATALFAITEIGRILNQAIANRQEFTVQLEAGVKKSEPIGDWATCHSDGSCEIRVVVKPRAAPKNAPIESLRRLG